MIPTSQVVLTAEKSKFRKILILLLVIAVLIYSSFWYFASQLVQNSMVRALDRSQAKKNILNCEDMGKEGYPLRVGVHCKSFSFRQAPAGTEFRAEKLKATAPIYALKWVEVSASSPAFIQIPGLLPLQADWKELKLNGDIDKSSIPNNITLITEDINIAIKTNSEQSKAIFSADLFRLDAQGINNTLTANLAFDKAKLPFVADYRNLILPAITGMVRLQLNNSHIFFYDRLSDTNDFREILRGQNGTIERAEFELENGGKLNLSGPFSIDESGYINADFNLSIGDQAALSRSARNIFPSQMQNMSAIFFVINSMPKNSQGEPVFKIKIKYGTVKLGFIKLGIVPPL